MRAVQLGTQPTEVAVEAGDRAVATTGDSALHGLSRASGMSRPAVTPRTAPPRPCLRPPQEPRSTTSREATRRRRQTCAPALRAFVGLGVGASPVPRDGRVDPRPANPEPRLHDLRLIVVHEDGQQLLLADPTGRYRSSRRGTAGRPRRDRPLLGQLHIAIDGGATARVQRYPRGSRRGGRRPARLAPREGRTLEGPVLAGRARRAGPQMWPLAAGSGSVTPRSACPSACTTASSTATTMGLLGDEGCVWQLT